jgi:hypothetical protein
VKHSAQALGLPGKLTIMVVFLVPAESREVIANGVSLIDSLKRAITMPGASRSKISFVAVQMSLKKWRLFQMFVILIVTLYEMDFPFI